MGRPELSGLLIHNGDSERLDLEGPPTFHPGRDALWKFVMDLESKS